MSTTTALQFYQLSRYGSFLLISVLLVKFGLPQDVIGKYETFLFIAGIVSFFWIGGLLNTSLSIYPEKEDKGKFLFNLIFSLSFINGLACSAVFFYFHFSGDFFPYINILIPYIFLNNLSFLVEYVYLMKKNSTRLFIYSILIHSALLFLVCLCLFTVAGDLRVLFWSLVIYAALKCSWLLLQVWPLMRFQLDLKEISYLWKYATPLILSMLLAGSGEYIDGLIIKYYFNDSAFAIFRYGAKELPLVLLVANSFSTSTIPKVAENLEHSLPYIKRNSYLLIHLLFPISIILIACSDWLYVFVFDDEFLQSASLFRIYILLVIFRLMFPQTILIGLKKTKVLMSISAIEILLNVSLSLYFVQFWGLRGIAIATVIAYFADKVISAGYVYFTLNINPRKYIPMKTLSFYTFILLLSYYLVVQFV
ncbi:MAG: oligosaccharide flippase family protein [Chitinophagales bacterium]|nr:oligosaccharide flippase family protein [Chitinophagales bacterium]